MLCPLTTPWTAPVAAVGLGSVAASLPGGFRLTLGGEALAWWAVPMIEIASACLVPSPSVPQGMPITLSLLPTKGSQVPRSLGLEWGH